MTTFFVDFVNGLDANNGLGPDASHASNKPWKTLTKLLGASGMASGDTAYLSPAGPFRETVTVAMTSATVETRIIGDTANAQGFKTSGGALVTGGPVVHSAYTTNDTTVPSSSALLALSARDFLTFEKIKFVGGLNASTSHISASAHSTDIIFRDCGFVGMAAGTAPQTISFTGAADTASNWTIERCVFTGNMGTVINVTMPTSASADYDINFQIRNCMFMAATPTVINITASGAGSFKGGGVDISYCYMAGRINGVITASANVSTSIPCTVYNCEIFSSNSVALSANASGQIVEDYNLLFASTPRTNVTAGSNSKSDGSYAPLFHDHYDNFVVGGTVRSFGTPNAGSPLLGFGAGVALTTDMTGLTRPAGGSSTSNGVGPIERHNTWVRETTTVRTGSNALSCTGPGDHSFGVQVDPVSTTLSVYMRYDATHAATNKPQMIVANGEECGVSTATATMTAAADTWEQISLTFTPARAGIVTVRFVSRSAAGGGKAFADDFAVS
jgi:hypothetical protein